MVTPNGSTHTYIDPLTEHAQLPQQPRVSTTHQVYQNNNNNNAAPAPATTSDPLPISGDMSGELSQVQKITMEMVAHQQQQEHAKNLQLAAAAAAATQPLLPNNKNTVQATTTQPKPVQPRPVAAAQTLLAQNMAAAAAAQQPPPSKRPRVNAAAPVSAKAATSYSFASSSSVQQSAASTVDMSTSGPGGRQEKSQAQIDRRRERNRILARRTRLRKKFFFESLQKDVADLQRENAALKSIVRSRLKPDDARSILAQCNANERLPSSIHSAEIAKASSAIPGGISALTGETTAAPKKLDKEDFSLIQSIQNSQQCFIITDPSLHDNPIVYASNDFLTLTGYSQEEVLGRNCRFLQGTETCQEKVGKIRKAVSLGEDVNVTLANYTSDGKPFWNSLFIAALRDADNNIVNFIGVIVKVDGPDKGDSEYGKILK